MNVGGAALDRIEQNLVDESNDGRVFYFIAMIVFVLVILTCYIEILEVEVVIVETLHTGIDGFDRFVDALFKLVLFDNNRIDTKAGRKLDVIDGLQVRGIRNAQKYPLTAFHQWQYAMLVDQFLVNSPNNVQIDFDGIKVE